MEFGGWFFFYLGELRQVGRPEFAAQPEQVVDVLGRFDLREMGRSNKKKRRRQHIHTHTHTHTNKQTNMETK